MVHTDNRVNSLLDNADLKKPPANSVSFLYDLHGQRKYLTSGERRSFLKVAKCLPPLVELFLTVLAFTGARISEVLALTQANFDEAEGVVIIECLKKRRRGVFRAVPLPESLIEAVLAIRKPDGRATAANQRIWDWSRTTAWKWVKKAMLAARISGPKASPKGLRHAFGVNSLQSVPLTVLKKWLGHSRLSTTEIYAAAVGPEERAIAVEAWRTF